MENNMYEASQRFEEKLRKLNATYWSQVCKIFNRKMTDHIDCHVNLSYTFKSIHMLRT